MFFRIVPDDQQGEVEEPMPCPNIRMDPGKKEGALCIVS